MPRYEIIFIGVRRTKRLSPRFLSCRVALRTVRRTKKLSPFRSGSKLPRNSGDLSPLRAGA